MVAGDFPTLRRIIARNPGGPLGAICNPREVNEVAAAIESIIRASPEEAARLRSGAGRQPASGGTGTGKQPS